MDRLPFHALVFALWGLALPGCGDLFYVEAEVEKICQSLPNLQTPAAPPGATGSVQSSLEFDLGDKVSVLEDGTVEAELELTSLTLVPKSGVSNLSFIELANVSVQKTGQAIIDYVRPASLPPGGSLLLNSHGATDLIPHLLGGALRLNYRLTGTFPTQAWSMDVTACFHLRTRVNYTELVQTSGQQP